MQKKVRFYLRGNDKFVAVMVWGIMAYERMSAVVWRLFSFALR